MGAIPKGTKVVELQTITTGLTSPLMLTHAGDNRLFVVDQIGRIRVILNGSLLMTPFLNLATATQMTPLSSGYDERGFLGLAFHPNYSQNGRFYVYYTAPTTTSGFDHKNVLSEFTVSGNPNIANTAEHVILSFDHPQSNHNGGHIEFGPDGYLYIASGDGGGANDNGTNHTPVIGNAQDTTNLLGKILRIDVDNQSPGLQYAIPADNPFFGSATNKPEIYAWGFRNPYGFSFDKGGAHQLYAGDVGQGVVEEVDIVTIGDNYGWKAMEGTNVFDPNVPVPPGGFVPPVAEYLHPDGTAVIGGFVYRGSAIPGLGGTYVFGDLCTGPSLSPPAGRLFYLDQNSQVKEFMVGWDDRGLGAVYLKGFGEDINGELYVLVTTNLGPSGTTGQVIKLIPTANPATAGFVDDFASPGTNGWGGGSNVSNPGTGGVGGAGDGYLLVNNSFSGNFGTFSQNPDYQGDWITAGITSVSFRLNDVNIPQPFEIHFSITNAGGTIWQNNTGFHPSNNVWQQYSVDVTSDANWTRTSGTDSFDIVLHDVDKVHFRHDLAPYVMSPNPISGDLGIDMITLVVPSIPTIAQAKLSSPGTVLTINGQIVTAAFPGMFYIEDPNRASGIKVISQTSVQEDDIVNVTGAVQATSSEAEIQASYVYKTQNQDTLTPLGMPNRSLGGRMLGLQSAIAGAAGLNNIGLLVRTYGIVTRKGADYLYIDDGSNLRDGTSTGPDANVGVRISCDPTSYDVNDIIAVTGISSVFVTPSAQIARQILIRSQSDIMTLP